MKVKKAPAGSTLFKAGQSIQFLYIIAEGAVGVHGKQIDFTLEKGNLIGLLGEQNVLFPFDYVAQKDTTLYEYDYKNPDDLSVLLSDNKEASGLIIHCFMQMCKQLLDSHTQLITTCDSLLETISQEYSQYLALCKSLGKSPEVLPGLNQAGEFQAKKSCASWMCEYYNNLCQTTSAKWRSFVEMNISLTQGFILNASKDALNFINDIILFQKYLEVINDLYISEYNLDLFTYYSHLLEQHADRIDAAGPIMDRIDKLIENIQNNAYISSELKQNKITEYKALVAKIQPTKASGAGAASDTNLERIMDELRNSFDTIITYAGLEETKCNQFRQHLKQYIALSDRGSSEDTVRKLRKQLTAEFYETYQLAFFKSIGDQEIPTVLKMFFYFGYMDLTLANEENALFMYHAANRFVFREQSHVYPMYFWLLEIYHKRKDPSVNEFNVDYISYLRQKKNEGSINAAKEAELLNNGKMRVIFEFENMLTSTNRMISGRIVSFCPIFSDHALYKPLEQSMLSDEMINRELLHAKTIDFSLFYRETIYTAPEIGITKEVIQVEVLPDIILMPNYGTRGAMWQEITGKKRTSPSRFVFPFFLMEDLFRSMVRVCGEFRWELCRRIQGARWNDISERSLTSDYCDYLQTFKKSKDLTPEAKEKLKAAYAKVRNNSKEMFVHDYLEYILFESTGSLRMNKLTRAILFTYCPFSKSIRQSISSNTLYKDIVERYAIKNAHAVHMSDLSITKIQKSGVEVPVEIRQFHKFLNM